MKLYIFPPSPNVRKVDAVIRHLGIEDVERVIVNLAKGEQRSPAFLAVNPMGKLPALDTGDGLLLWESNAICQYLCERHGGTSFYPWDYRVRADIARWLFWEASAWSPATGVLTNENVRKPMLGLGRPDPESVQMGEERVWPLAKLLDEQLTFRPFLVGQEVTLADFVVGGAATYMDRGRFPVDDLPNLKAWWARLNQIEAWADSTPSPDLPE
jgi:glutathione S-transferase